jgi:hypothetical protein
VTHSLKAPPRTAAALLRPAPELLPSEHGSVSSYPHAEPELVSKATLAAGEIYESLGQRSSAIKKYQELIAVRTDSLEAKSARQFLIYPYCIN